MAYPADFLPPPTGNTLADRTDPRSGFCPETKTFRSLRPPVHLPPPSLPLSFPAFALSLLPSPLPSHPALINAATGAAVSFPDFFSRANALAAALHSHTGLSHGHVAFILSPATLDVPVLYFALLSLGATIAPANPAATAAELSRLLRLTNPYITFATSSTAPKLPSKLPTILLDSPRFRSLVDTQNPATSSFTPPMVVQQSDVAAIQFSSGTTGFMKAVALPHRSFIAMTAGFRALRAGQDGPDVTLLPAPMFHSMGFFVTLKAVALGEALVVMDRAALPEMLAAAERYRATQIIAAPPVVVWMARSEDAAQRDLSTLARVFCGGAPLPVETAERFSNRFPRKLICQMAHLHARVANARGKDPLAAPDVADELVLQLDSLIPHGFPVDSWTVDRIHSIPLTVTRFLSKARIITSVSDEEQRTNIVSLGVIRGYFADACVCTLRNFVDFCEYLRTPEGQDAMRERQYRVRLEKRGGGRHEVPSVALISALQQQQSDLAAVEKRIRIDYEAKNAELQRQIQSNRRSEEMDIAKAREKHSPAGMYTGMSDTLFTNHCIAFYEKECRDNGLQARALTDFEMAEVEAKYGPTVKEDHLLAFIRDPSRQEKLIKWVNRKIRHFDKHSDFRRANSFRQLLAVAGRGTAPSLPPGTEDIPAEGDTSGNVPRATGQDGEPTIEHGSADDAPDGAQDERPETSSASRAKSRESVRRRKTPKRTPKTRGQKRARAGEGASDSSQQE